MFKYPRNSIGGLVLKKRLSFAENQPKEIFKTINDNYQSCEATTMLNVDKDSASAVTFVTDATSFYRNPSTVANTSEATAKIEL